MQQLYGKSTVTMSRSHWVGMAVRVCVCTIVLSSITAFVACYKPAEAEIHLIPDRYVGRVLIVHSVPGGIPAEYDDGTRLYRVPLSGVVLSQSSPNPGLGRRGYAYVHGDGDRVQRIPLEIAYQESNQWDAEVRVRDIESGWYGNPGEPCSMPYDSYFIGTLSDAQEKHASGHGESDLKELWNKCRDALSIEKR